MSSQQFENFVNISIIDQGKIVKTSSMKSLLKRTSLGLYSLNKRKDFKMKLENLGMILIIPSISVQLTIEERNEVLKIFQNCGLMAN